MRHKAEQEKEAEMRQALEVELTAMLERAEMQQRTKREAMEKSFAPDVCQICVKLCSCISYFVPLRSNQNISERVLLLKGQDDREEEKRRRWFFERFHGS